MLFGRRSLPLVLYCLSRTPSCDVTRGCPCKGRPNSACNKKILPEYCRLVVSAPYRRKALRANIRSFPAAICMIYYNFHNPIVTAVTVSTCSSLTASCVCLLIRCSLLMPFQMIFENDEKKEITEFSMQFTVTVHAFAPDIFLRSLWKGTKRKISTPELLFMRFTKSTLELHRGPAGGGRKQKCSQKAKVLPAGKSARVLPSSAVS